MTVRRTILQVEELSQRVLPSVSPLQPAGIVAHSAAPASATSSSAALKLLESVNPGGPMQPAPTATGNSTALNLLEAVNPGGPMQPAQPVNPGGPMQLAQSVNPGGPMQPAPVDPGDVEAPADTVNSGSLPLIAQAQVNLGQPGSLLGGTSRPAQQLVIHSAQQLLADTGMTTTQLASDLNVPSIDWNTQMIVLVSQGTGGYGAFSPKVDITALNDKHGELTVQWNLNRPNPDQPFPMYMMIADPAEVVLTTNFTGPVKFHQNPTITLPPPSYAD